CPSWKKPSNTPGNSTPKSCSKRAFWVAKSNAVCLIACRVAEPKHPIPEKSWSPVTIMPNSSSTTSNPNTNPPTVQNFPARQNYPTTSSNWSATKRSELLKPLTRPAYHAWISSTPTTMNWSSTKLTPCPDSLRSPCIHKCGSAPG